MKNERGSMTGDRVGFSDLVMFPKRHIKREEIIAAAINGAVLGVGFGFAYLTGIHSAALVAGITVGASSSVVMTHMDRTAQRNREE
jgi:hypothetical protein